MRGDFKIKRWSYNLNVAQRHMRVSAALLVSPGDTLRVPEGCMLRATNKTNALIAQSAERILGKDEVTGSSPVKGSIWRRSSAG